MLECGSKTPINLLYVHSNPFYSMCVFLCGHGIISQQLVFLIVSYLTATVTHSVRNKVAARQQGVSLFVCITITK